MFIYSEEDTGSSGDDGGLGSLDTEFSISKPQKKIKEKEKGKKDKKDKHQDKISQPFEKTINPLKAIKKKKVLIPPPTQKERIEDLKKQIKTRKKQKMDVQQLLEEQNIATNKLQKRNEKLQNTFEIKKKRLKELKRDDKEIEIEKEKEKENEDEKENEKEDQNENEIKKEEIDEKIDKNQNEKSGSILTNEDIFY
ncbi:hypothetical protein M0812_19732 [Anaeramoeba flamelloides]|uniref:Uncharacterized protein n=1 Tax=Anaeramoeba flamelloides TaxID=1746091 RepID=A0AAV7Z608_9EUKA|nr:hypothetical protein M0812_19732 [Anaeramoeba flamelloides]